MMRTRPYYIGTRWFSVATWKSPHHWYLLPSLELEPYVQLGADTVARRWIVSWLVWRSCLEWGRPTQTKPRRQRLEQLPWDDFLIWAKRKHPTIQWEKDQILPMLEQHMYLKKILLDKGLHLHYSKLMVLRVMLENKPLSHVSLESMDVSSSFSSSASRES